MVIHAHILAYNEEKILPFTLDYYSTICEKIFVYDNMSTDSSDEIYKRYPKVTVIKWNSNNEINDKNYIDIKSNCYKETSKDADWVIVCDCDEILYHQNLINMLKYYKKIGVDVPKIDGHDMVSEKFPEYDGKLITELVKTGSDTYEPMCKNILINPKKNVNYGFGAHNMFCENCVFSEDAELMLLHYKFLGLDYVANRYGVLEKRLSEFNKQNGFGSHYTQKNAHEYMEHLLKNKKEII